MQITILTLFPDMVKPFFADSIIKRAQDKGLVSVRVVNFRDFAHGSHRTVDQPPYGGGAGMVLMVEPIVTALRSLNLGGIGPSGAPATCGIPGTRVLLTSVAGRRYSQAVAREYARLDHLVLIAGHYEGVDDRIFDYVDGGVSIGDYVMTGGEIACAAIADSVIRLLPGVLSKDGATDEESFFTVTLKELRKAVGPDEYLDALSFRFRKAGRKDAEVRIQLLEYPHYTRPEEFEGKRIPQILLSGHHRKIATWRLQQAYKRTRTFRADLLDKLARE
ncbi:MAG: tRNA (guanosine(37)-N1)-methyltransferase TrmD [Patescibacteria group bacterium]|nr:tRNA (guanosine(37)-N1)-methyltransferase TrmD [Patescibacteria group bacterium]